MKKLFLVITFGLLMVSLVAAQGSQPNESPELLESSQLNSRVMKLYSEGKYSDALPLAKRALELREKALGSSDENLIPLLVNLAELNWALKKPRDTQAYLERALKIGESVFGPEDIRITRVLDKLAPVTYGQGNQQNAENLFARSLKIKEKTLGLEHPEVAQTAFNLAELYRLRADYSKAEPLYQRVISIREKSSGKDNSELVRALQGYVAVLSAQRKTEEGAQAQKRIAELLEKGTIEGGVLNGRAVKLVSPPYPLAARRDFASGVVTVKVLIDETGNVIQAKAINSGSTNLALVAAAENAARRCLFTPTLLSGTPVKVSGVIIFRFIAQ